ncbi:phenazine biosynthesis-like protein [Xylona heveae TC161]|uniref:Phenazine biosynthesis-like protein n=1 Tax=Xylona heveae (strain CBS 132557 / TC161) TaxID=1328760 RepID=A0A165GJG5_XYLHT|nr:phenazine biosynthesis-like protein [Xylona heveae TC161]KZF22263.1 phenazine biosynthesis-like protein [Xylona heveae TC161]
MQLSYVVVDVFTTTRYEGNPLAIVKLPAEQRNKLSQQQKQAIAKEFNLSETVFVHEPSEGEPVDTIAADIFTIETELPFAGHPTIGTAYYLLKEQGRNVKTLLPKAGPISLNFDGKVVGAQIPQKFHIHDARLASNLSDDRNSPIASIVKELNFVLIRLPDTSTLGNANKGVLQNPYQPDTLDEGWQKGVLGSYFYVSLGIDRNGRQAIRTRMHLDFEDPATGSAASTLACYLSLQEPASKGAGPFEYAITQGVEMGRRSDIIVKVVRNSEGTGIETVTLSGAAIKVMEGVLEVDV